MNAIFFILDEHFENEYFLHDIIINMKLDKFSYKEVRNMKIKGFGGVFWRTKDVESLKNWYEQTLGLSMGEWNGKIFKPDVDNQTIFSLFNADSDYFPGEQSVMLNFQVENIEACLEHFNKIGVPLVKQPEKSEFGTFVWIADPEGRWIELWEK